MPSVIWKLLVFALMLGVCSGHRAWVLAQPAAPAAPPAAAAPGGGLDDSPFLEEPKTVDEFFNAVTFSIRLARPNLARRYLEGMMGLSPDDETLLQLRDKYGPGVFLKLANVPELQPLSTELLDRVNEAFRRRGADPSRIDAILKDLGGTAQQRDVAIVTLRSAGPVVVPRILSVLADPASMIDKDLLTDALVKMGNPVIPPLIAALDSPDTNLQSTVIQVLGYLADRNTASYLWYPAFGPGQSPGVQVMARESLKRIFRQPGDRAGIADPQGVTRELKRIALENFRMQREWPLGDDKRVEFWSWDPAAGTVVAHHVTPEAASLAVAARFARQALATSPERPDLQSLLLAATLASEAYQAGWDRPLVTGQGTAHDLGLSSGEEVTADALATSMESGNTRGAVAALQVLSQVGTRHLLTKTTLRQSPVLAALNYPDPRVQFAAAMTVLQLDPVEPFRGADRVVAILSRSLTGTGDRRILVCHPNAEKAGNVAGQFGELGYQPLIAQTGRDAFRIATESPDVELILLDYNTIQWDLTQTVANLRADARSATIPIVIFGPESRRADVANVLRRYPRTAYLVESTTASNAQVQLRPFIETLTTPPVSGELRAAQASAAAFWLAQIAGSQRNRIFPLANAEKALIGAAEDPVLADNVIRALGAIGSRSSQQELQQIAVNEQSDVKFRELAAAQLAQHIQRYGLMLSLEQVSALEQKWRSATDPAVSTALASVVGSLKPNAQRVSDRLRQFPSPVGPPAAPQP